MAIFIEKLVGEALDNACDDLAEILYASVHAGASVSFILPFSKEDAADFWRNKVIPSVRAGGTVLFGVREEDRIVGTVQLITDLPPNQAHRGEVAKLLVHPAHRGKGLARTLMVELIDEARRQGLSLVTLDTRTGDAAQPLYASMGFEVAGIIPAFAKAPDCDRLDATTYMYLSLGKENGAPDLTTKA